MRLWYPVVMKASLPDLAIASDQPLAAFSDLVSAALAAEDGTAEVERAMRRFQVFTRRMISQLRATLKALAKAAEAGEKIDFDALIDDLEKREKNAARNNRRTERMAASLQKMLRRAEPERLVALAPIMGEFSEAAADFLEALRDARIDLVIMQDRLDPSESGPVLSSPVEVRRYFAEQG